MIYLHTENYILHLSKDYLFQVFQKFIYSQIYHVHHKHQVYSKYILNPDKLNTLFKNIKLKQKFDLFIIKYFFIIFFIRK